MTVIVVAASVVPPLRLAILKILPRILNREEECASQSSGAGNRWEPGGLPRCLALTAGADGARWPCRSLQQSCRTADLRQVQATGVRLRGSRDGTHRFVAVEQLIKTVADRFGHSFHRQQCGIFDGNLAESSLQAWQGIFTSIYSRVCTWQRRPAASAKRAGPNHHWAPSCADAHSGRRKFMPMPCQAAVWRYPVLWR